MRIAGFRGVASIAGTVLVAAGSSWGQTVPLFVPTTNKNANFVVGGHSSPELGYEVTRYVVPGGSAVTGAINVGFSPAGLVSTDGGNVQAPGTVLLALDFVGTRADIATLIAVMQQTGLPIGATVGPAFGEGYDAMLRLDGQSSANYLLTYDLSGSNVTLAAVAAVPEPTGMAVGVGLMPLVLRRRR